MPFEESVKNLYQAQKIVQNLFDSPLYKQKFDELKIEKSHAIDLCLKLLAKQSKNRVCNDTLNIDSKYNKNNYNYIIHEKKLQIATEKFIKILEENITSDTRFKEFFPGVKQFRHCKIADDTMQLGLFTIYFGTTLEEFTQANQSLFADDATFHMDLIFEVEDKFLKK